MGMVRGNVEDTLIPILRKRIFTMNRLIAIKESDLETEGPDAYEANKVSIQRLKRIKHSLEEALIEAEAY